MRKKPPLIGGVFGRLTIISEAKSYYDSKGKQITKSLVRCVCGVEKIVTNHSLHRNKTKSCGCLQKEKASIQGKNSATHGLSKSRVFNSYNAMKQRCYYDKHKDYHNYGGRGIKICERWLNSFENFLADMGHPPPKTTLDRKNSNGNYEPDNCRWADHKTQAFNQRNTKHILFNNELMSLSEACRRLDRQPSVPLNMAKRLNISLQACVDYLSTSEAKKLRHCRFNLNPTTIQSGR